MIDRHTWPALLCRVWERVHFLFQLCKRAVHHQLQVLASEVEDAAVHGHVMTEMTSGRRVRCSCKVSGRIQVQLHKCVRDRSTTGEPVPLLAVITHVVVLAQASRHQHILCHRPQCLPLVLRGRAVTEEVGNGELTLHTTPWAARDVKMLVAKQRTTTTPQLNPARCGKCASVGQEWRHVGRVQQVSDLTKGGLTPIQFPCTTAALQDEQGGTEGSMEYARITYISLKCKCA